MKEYLDTSSGQLDKTMQEVLAKNKAQILKIKDVCTKYFEKNDGVVNGMQEKFQVVNSTYDDFVNNVVKPQQLGEARLFAVETRLKEEEDLRILEFSHVKDVVKKLIFAIEQANLTAKDTNSSSNIDSSQPLPNLLKNTSLSAKGRGKSEKDSRVNINAMQNKGFDILFIKRLMYLKNSIDDDKHIAKEQREFSKDHFELSNPNQYGNTMSSALLSLKQETKNDPTMSEKVLSSQGKSHCANSVERASQEQKTFNNYRATFSPQRVQTADKLGGRFERIHNPHEKALSQNRNGQNLKNANNTFFITQMNKEKKSRLNLNKSVVTENKTTSHRRLNKTGFEVGEDDYVVLKLFAYRYRILINLSNLQLSRK